MKKNILEDFDPLKEEKIFFHKYAYLLKKAIMAAERKKKFQDV